MTKKHISKSNAERCKNYRKRLKAKPTAKDAIDKTLDNRVKSAKKEQKIEKKPIDFDNWDSNWLDPQRELREQFQVSEEPHYNFWGQKEGEHNILDDISHQKNLKALFGDKHSE